MSLCAPWPLRSSFARPGQVDPKVRSVGRSDGSTECWPRHRPSLRRREWSQATSKVVLRKRRYSCCKCTDPRCLGTLARRTQHVLATAPQVYKHASQLGQASHLEILTIQMNHVEYHMAMEWPIDARNRRNVPCACFGHTPKRVARSLRTKKCL